MASALITVQKKHKDIHALNLILADFSTEIIGRQGISIPGKNINIISIIMESDIDTINNLAGKIGKLSGINVKIIISKD
ncbi:MAG: iron-only hydrogenase system regulator [Ignavibacteriae bacterium]|nr:MAG: iron-only hydrogenase system regulator [Ignavibacteriota bacterium]